MPVWRGTRCDLLNEVGRFAMTQAYVIFATGDSFGKEKKANLYQINEQNISGKWNVTQAHIFNTKKQDLDSPAGKQKLWYADRTLRRTLLSDRTPTAVASQWQSYNKEICVRSIRRSTAGIGCEKYGRDLPALSCSKSSIYHSVVVYFVLRTTVSLTYKETQWIWNIFSVSGRFHFNRTYE